jgi:hypothetical protein
MPALKSPFLADLAALQLEITEMDISDIASSPAEPVIALTPVRVAVLRFAAHFLLAVIGLTGFAALMAHDHTMGRGHTTTAFLVSSVLHYPLAILAVSALLVSVAWSFRQNHAPHIFDDDTAAGWLVTTLFFYIIAGFVAFLAVNGIGKVLKLEFGSEPQWVSDIRISDDDEATQKQLLVASKCAQSLLYVNLQKSGATPTTLGDIDSAESKCEEMSAEKAAADEERNGAEAIRRADTAAKQRAALGAAVAASAR